MTTPLIEQQDLFGDRVPIPTFERYPDPIYLKIEPDTATHDTVIELWRREQKRTNNPKLKLNDYIKSMFQRYYAYMTYVKPTK